MAKQNRRAVPRRRRKKNILHSTFYRVYFVVVLACVIGIVIGAHWLGDVLEDYELAQPSHVAERTAQLFEDADYGAIYDYDTSAEALSGGDREFYAESLRRLAEGKEVSWSESYSGSEDEKHYSVALDGRKFARFTLVPSGERTAHGNRYWTLSSITTNVALQEPEATEAPAASPEAAEEPAPTQPSGILCRVSVPGAYRVEVDGVTLGPGNATLQQQALVAEDLLPKGVESPLLTEYSFYATVDAPQIRVTDASGAEQALLAEGDHSWSCAWPEDEELREKYGKAVVQVAKDIGRCAAKTVSKAGVLRYCAKNSPAYKSISNFDDSTGANRKQEKFRDVEVSNFFRYSDSCFSCHVSFTYLSKFTSKVIKEYPTTLTLYFTIKGDRGRLYSFTFY